MSPFQFALDIYPGTIECRISHCKIYDFFAGSDCTCNFISISLPIIPKRFPVLDHWKNKADCLGKLANIFFNYRKRDAGFAFPCSGCKYHICAFYKICCPHCEKVWISWAASNTEKLHGLQHNHRAI